MLTMGKIAKWCTDTLATDAGFTALSISLLGTALNFYRHSPVNRVEEVLPFLTAYSNEMMGDFDGQSPYRHTWEIPIALAIHADDYSVTDGSVTTWSSTDIIEELSVYAMMVLRRESNACGISGEYVRILSTRLIVTEIGEADDIQANIFLTFGEERNI